MNTTPETSPDPRLARLEERFREDGLAARLHALRHGLSLPRSSREHKLALRELGRLAAQAGSFALVMLAVLALLALPSPPSAVVARSVAVAENLEEPEPPEDLDPEPPETPPTADLPPQPDLVADAGVPDPVLEPVPVFEQPLTPKPADMMAVAKVVSPIVLTVCGRGVPGSPGSPSSDPFGYGEGARLESDLKGTLYDLKRDAAGNARSWSYYEDLRDLLADGFGASTSKVFALPRNLYLSHLLVPKQSAANGPRAFGVDDLMEPRGWVARYVGEINPDHSGTFRLAGHFDDVLIVRIDGRTVLDAGWAYNGRKSPVTGWEPKERVGAHDSFSGQPLTYGDWVKLESGVPHRLEILCGENPGGLVGGVLLVEEKGAQYAHDPAGRPILPLFATSRPEADKPLDASLFGGFQFASDTPAMNLTAAQRALLANAHAYTNRDVRVSVRRTGAGRDSSL